ncbi:zinc-dependent metalloprotease [Candidatus Uabimicrobium sp. HlEnr_7]|uniref:zinc-dependent metalloprotease n=1 Tax=Candidatus Uabimicrobium helgolandensis TaxID=3095367 RepID=UPI0035584BBF
MKKYLVVTLLFAFITATIVVADEKKEKPEFPSVDKIVKKMTPLKGFLSLYKKNEELYALVPSSKFNKPFLLAMTISSGVYGGMQWDHMMVYWQKQGKKLLLMRPDLRYRAEKTTMKNVVNRTFPATIIRAVPIIGKNGSNYLIDLAGIFKSDIAGLSAVAPFLIGGRLQLNPTLSSWNKVKVFPSNIELGVKLAFTGTKFTGDENFTDTTDPRRSYPLSVHFSLASIPSSGYKPRVADSRVGYFGVAVKDFSKKYNERNKFNRYINRWHLEKIDSSLELSPAKNPIIFYIEKTVPYRYRKHVKEGILEWNKAFEKIGIVDAVIVRQQTKTQFADLDPEDARYNFFRWTTNELGFAAGPSRVNPMTGQILDADIIFDDSMLRYAASSHNSMNNALALIKSDAKFSKMIERLGKLSPLKRLQHLIPQKEQIRLQHKQNLLSVMRKRNIPVCTHGEHKGQQLRLAYGMMRAAGKKDVPLAFIGQFIKEVTMHEVGHTLGLYHNFKGSSWLSIDKINSSDKPAATSGSVMDYNPINFAPKGTTQGNYLTTTLGPYDYWAIEYGYKQVKDAELQKIAMRCAEDGLSYGNDLYASIVDSDPFIFRWDLSSDHIAHAKQNMKLLQQLSNDILQRYVSKGEEFHPVRQAFDMLLAENAYSCIVVARSIGGQFLHWDHKGDPNARAPFVVVKAEEQRKALQFLNQTIFTSPNFSSEVLNHLAPGTWWHWGTNELDAIATYPVHDMVTAYQTLILFNLIEPMTLMRLSNSPLQVKKGEEIFTIADLLDGLTDGMWVELNAFDKEKKYSNSEPLISSFRRNLQQVYLSFWIYYLLDDEMQMPIPADAKSVALKNLSSLLEKIQNILENKDNLDSTSLAHLLKSKYHITEFIDE